MNNIIGNILLGIRQWKYPKSFRIPAVRSVAFDKEFGDTLSALRETLDIFSSPENVENIMKFTAADDHEFIAELLTRLWRFRKSMKIEDDVNVEKQPNYNQLERIFSIFEKMEFHIDDREGDIYDSGLTMKVIASEPMEGIGREVIKETYKPGIYRGNTLIQVPEIIVGLPIVEVSNEDGAPGTSDSNEKKKDKNTSSDIAKKEKGKNPELLSKEEVDEKATSEEVNEETYDESESRPR